MRHALHAALLAQACEAAQQDVSKHVWHSSSSAENPQEVEPTEQLSEHPSSKQAFHWLNCVFDAHELGVVGDVAHVAHAALSAQACSYEQHLAPEHVSQAPSAMSNPQFASKTNGLMNDSYTAEMRAL